MKWLDNLLGHPADESRDEDEEAIKELRSSFKRVRVRTDRLIEAYAKAEAQRVARKKA